jgi:Cellulase (glycosyl hydrolase family 5)
MLFVLVLCPACICQVFQRLLPVLAAAEAQHCVSHHKIPLHNIAGINLPPLQGTTNTGAFSSGPLNNGYTQQQVEDTVCQRKGVRVPVNPPTVFDKVAWEQTRNVVTWALNKGAIVVLCMWDSDEHDINCDGHGDGLLDSEEDARNMWKHIGEAFGHDPRVFFEAFNEPFGYEDAKEYVHAMRRITRDLPEDRVIIDGMAAARHLHSIKHLWPGLLAYHIYTARVPEECRSTRAYSESIQHALRGVAHRTVVTEFGADLSLNEDYDNVDSTSSDVQLLNGLEDALRIMKPCASFMWHGWDNGDTYSFWGATPAARAKLDSIQKFW